jgi:hypothetical protein
MTLRVYWPLNEDSGSTAYDHSGNENHGTINDGSDSTITGASGPLGQKAYSFDGKNDNVTSEASDFKEFTGNYPWSISMWVYDRGQTSTYTALLSNYGSQGMIIQIRDDRTPSHTVNLYTNDSNSDFDEVYYPDDEWIEGQWNHVYVEKTGPGASNSSIFVNGKENTITYESEGANNIKGDGKFSVGNTAYNDSRYFDGKISELRIYKRALTRQEIQYIYTASKRGRQVTNKKSF